jgi:hypothetical protein
MGMVEHSSPYSDQEGEREREREREEEERKKREERWGPNIPFKSTPTVTSL